MATSEHACARCGTVFTATRSHAKYCGQYCRNKAAKHVRADRMCAVCGSSYTPTGGRQRTCGRTCGQELRKRTTGWEPIYPSWLVRFPSCSGCGRAFSSRRRDARWCSYACRVADIGDRVLSLYRLSVGLTGESRAWRRVLVGYLRERDGDRCGICRGRIDFGVKSGPRGDRRGASIDHVVPRSLWPDGVPGVDGPANLRLAHWGCNQRRGNRGGGEQLALVG